MNLLYSDVIITCTILFFWVVVAVIIIIIIIIISYEVAIGEHSKLISAYLAKCFKFSL